MPAIDPDREEFTLPEILLRLVVDICGPEYGVVLPDVVTGLYVFDPLCDERLLLDDTVVFVSAIVSPMLSVAPKLFKIRF